MFFIPGWLISLFTFPGVIVHELAHEYFCRKFGVIVYDVCYFRPLENPAGYVLHGEVTNYKQAFWISVGPLVINTVTAIFIAFPVVLLFFDLEVFQITPMNSLLMWLGVSLGMNAFPSVQDAKMLLESSQKACQKGNPWGYLGFPVAGLIHLLNAGSIIWLDLVFALGVIYLVPKGLVLLIAQFVN